MKTNSRLSRGFSQVSPKENVIEMTKKLQKPLECWEDKNGDPEFYETVDSMVIRAVYPLRQDPHFLNAHPRDVNNIEYRHMLIYADLSPYKYKRLMNKQMGIDEFEVEIDPETFRFRDVLKRHFKNIKEPVPPQDGFVVWSFYWIMGYFLWVFLKQLGTWIRKPYLEERKRKADRVELKRIEEEKVSSDMVMRSRSPQAFFRYDFDGSTTELRNRLDEIDRLLKDPKPLVKKG
jgi:hypothetical protein